MHREKIVSIVGARPQFIKAAMICREMGKYPDLQHIVVHTGQHFDNNMSEIFFQQMHMPEPDFNLDIHGLSHGAMTGRMLEALEKLLAELSPKIVIVYGDTNTTLAGALAASKLKLDVAHVESGLRSFNMDMPEEVNRTLTDRVSDILFCPTAASVSNLRDEGFEKRGCRMIRCGDVMYDAAIHFSKMVTTRPTVVNEFGDEDYVLCTIHRAENTDDIDKLRSIFEGLNRIAAEVRVIVPLHPRTKKVVEGAGIQADFLIVEPVGFLEMIGLLKNCRLVITDSGGVQKEAYFYRKMCLTLREETEWVELVEMGCNKLVGSDPDMIHESFTAAVSKEPVFESGTYGNGRASEAIVNELRAFISSR